MKDNNFFSLLVILAFLATLIIVLWTNPNAFDNCEWAFSLTSLEYEYVCF